MDLGGEQAGSLLRRYREASGLSQRELARAAGISIGVVRDLEQGRTRVLRNRSAEALALALGLDSGVAGEFTRVARGLPPDLRATGSAPGSLRLGVLGPMVAWRGSGNVSTDAALELGPPVQRAVLGLLALRPGELVHRESVIDALWGDDPPASAVNQVQASVSRARRMLDPGRPPRDTRGLLVSSGTGYRLNVTSGQLDLLFFRDLAEQAETAGRAGDAVLACGRYEKALDLWRGDPLADIDALRQHPTVTGLSRRRSAAILGYAEAACSAGWHDRALPLLWPLTEREPLHERAHAALMIALAGTGRQDAALEVFEALRRRLDEQLGVRAGGEVTAAHLRVLHGDIPLPRPGPAPVTLTGLPARNGHRPAPVVPRQLPAAMPHFAGRSAELAVLSGLLSTSGAGLDTGNTPMIAVISGTAGVGKTALALHWAHQIAHRFPDGQLHVDLRGFAPSGSPAAPADALRGFLTALGIQPGQVPPAVDQQAALYRSLVAGKRLLIVLDNARDAAQVRTLLPGSPGCLVVVTSRSQLAGLVVVEGARPVSLDIMTETDAHELLARRLGAARVAAEPEAAAELLALCARLPLALAIAAARASLRPARSLAALAAELRDARSRLDALDVGDPGQSVRAVFSWSYRGLSDPAARMFRLASVHPGPGLGARAAASLAGAGLAQARLQLRELADAHLLAETVPGRFACHDLLRAYAAEQAEIRDGPGGCRAATHRMLDHYRHAAHAATLLLLSVREPLDLESPRPGVVPEIFDGDRSALDWFESEHEVLVMAIGQAASAGFDVHAWQLAWALSGFLNRRGCWPESAATLAFALAAAERFGDTNGQAYLHRELGGTQTQLGCYAEAHTHLDRALTLFRDHGDLTGQARTHGYIGALLVRQGHDHDALGHVRRALGLFQAAGRLAGQAFALNNLGWIHANLGNYTEAVACCRRALELHAEAGDCFGEAATWDSLGYAHHRLAQYAPAITCYEQALALLHEIGDVHYRYHMAGTLTHLGDTFQAAGNPRAARNAWQQALAILDELHHQDGDALRAKLCDSGRADGTRDQVR